LRELFQKVAMKVAVFLMFLLRLLLLELEEVKVAIKVFPE
jgi:hypothetical protein